MVTAKRELYGHSHSTTSSIIPAYPWRDWLKPRKILSGQSVPR